MVDERVVTTAGGSERTVAFMAERHGRGRHRKPRLLTRWRRSVAASLSRLVRSQARSRRAAETAALLAEVVALRTTVTEMRAALIESQATTERLAVELAAAHDAAAARTSLELPLVRLALQRHGEPALTRDTAAALAAPDRSPDTVTSEIVLPEHGLLDPATDRDRELVDHTSRDEDAAEPPARRTA